MSGPSLYELYKKQKEHVKTLEHRIDELKKLLDQCLVKTNNELKEKQETIKSLELLVKTLQQLLDACLKKFTNDFIQTLASSMIEEN